MTMHRCTAGAAEAASQSAERADALRRFAANLHKAFYGFEPDFFQQNLLRIVDDVLSVIKGSIELWPTLVDRLLPQVLAGRMALLHPHRPSPVKGGCLRAMGAHLLAYRLQAGRSLDEILMR